MNLTPGKYIATASVLSLLPLVLTRGTIHFVRYFNIRGSESSLLLFGLCVQIVAVVGVLFLWKSKIETNPKTNKVWDSAWYVTLFFATLVTGAFAVTMGDKIMHLFLIAPQVDLSSINPLNESFQTKSWVGLIISVLISPVLEEFIFRELMLGMWLGIVRSRVAVSLVSLSFALYHLPFPIMDSLSLWKFLIAEVPSLFIVGMALGAVRLRLSLWHAIAFHMAINGLLWFGSEDAKITANVLGLLCIPLLIFINYRIKKHLRTHDNITLDPME